MFPLFKQGIAAVAVMASLLSGLQTSTAQMNGLKPTASLASDELPKVPASLAREVEPYTRLSAYSLAGWDPSARELWTKSLASNAASVFSVSSPGNSLQPKLLIPAGGVYDIYFNHQGSSLVYVKDNGGNEVFQLYALDPS